MRIIGLLVFLFCCICGSAENCRVSGRIVDKKNKQALSNVNVRFQGTTIGTTTDDNGNFHISGVTEGEYVLGASLVGYEPKNQKIAVFSDVSNLLIEINEQSIEMDQVVVTASRTERDLKNVPIAVQVINSKTIEKMQVSTMRDLLEYELPGIDFKNNGGYANINMLGFGGKYVLFLIDGERMAGESFDNIDYNRINMENIERIEIIKGASSSLYGSNAVGGVINIITKKPDSPLSVRASARTGSFNEQNYNLSLSTKQKWGSISLNGSYKMKDPYLLKDTEPMTLEYDNGQQSEQALKETYIAGYTDYNINPIVMLNLSKKLQVELKGGYFFKERHPGGIDGKKVRDHFIDYTAGAKAFYTISDRQHLSVSANYDMYEKYDYYKLLDEREKKYANNQMRFSLLYDYLIGGRHALVAGAEFFSEELMTYMFESDGSNDKRNADTYSVFAQQDIVLSDQLTLVGGLRYDYHSEFNGHFSPRLSVMYRPVRKITFRGGYSGGFRSPTLKELYTDWYHPYGGGFQIKGNTDLKAETSNNFNISGEGIFGKTTVTAMAQYSLIKDKINNVWVHSDTTQYINVGDAKILSSEVTLSHRFCRSFQVKGSYAYVHDNLKRRSIVRPHSATVRGDYTSQLFRKYNPGISFSGKYFSGMNIYGTGDISETDGETGIEQEVSEGYKVWYEPYSVWRLTLSQPLPFNIILNAGINNLFDYKPKFSSFYSSISPGRTYYIELRWTLR